VILVDANLVLYAEDALSPQHEAARTWWDTQLSGASPVCLSWGVLCAFIRISTNSRVYERPLDLDQAMSRVQSWLDQPCVTVINPTERHAAVLRELLSPLGAAGNLTTDAHLAALAIEHGALLCSCDTDFARFQGLRWEDPLRRG